MIIDKGTLYIVGTPIGNLSDLSPRAAEVLAAADFIAAEDTRITLKLLNHLGIKKPLVSYYKQNEALRAPAIVSRLKSGEICALVSDAGMPLISDPGGEIVTMCRAEGVPVCVVPGPCAAIAALCVSGIESGRFAFEGFLPARASHRKEMLAQAANDTHTLVYYEAPHKLRRTLADMLGAFGDRNAAVCKELTKLHETTVCMTLSQACEYFSENTPRGEYVIVIEGAKESEKPGACDVTELLSRMIKDGMSKSEAAKAAAKAAGIPKSKAYEIALKL